MRAILNDAASAVVPPLGSRHCSKILLAISSRKPVPYYINLTLHPMMIKIEDEAVPCR